MPRRDGIDVSHWQGAIDWHAVAAAGIEWCAIKATQGTSYVDPTFARNRAAMRDAGIRYRLLYHWPEPGNDPAREADWYLRNVGTLDDGEGTMNDAEEEGLSVSGVVSWCQRVEEATGRLAVAVYTGAFVCGGVLWDSPEIYNGLRPRVFAAYTSESNARSYAAPQTWDTWQYTGSGSCPGVAGACDLDQVDDWPSFDAVCGGSAAVPAGDDEDFWHVHPDLVS